jgi:hypothetical protein
MRSFVAMIAVAACVACVDGTTPDCSTPASGCFPNATNGDASSDAADGSNDAPADVSADTNGEPDASDASSIPDVSSTTD